MPDKSAELNLACSSEYEDSEEDGSEGMQSAPRKIKPVDCPGLKLKTPIAFQQVSNLDMIPIRKEGMAVCEKCGAIGVKHSFYTKERRFCSQSCAKSFNEGIQMNSSSLDKRSVQLVTQPAVKKCGQPLEEVHIYSNKKRMQSVKDAKGSDKYGFDWVEMLSEPGFVVPPISSFRHAPLSDTWASDVSIGMKVEVENTDTRQSANATDPQSYWVASVVNLMDYKALLRYEGFGSDDSKDFWVNLGGEDVHPVGWCASKGKPLIPPRTIQDKYTEWREFLVKRLTGARSLPNQFHSRVIEACRSRFRLGTLVELIDRNRLSVLKVATVDMIVGRRLRLNYVDSQDEEPGFWCHEESPLIHPVGWANSVGHKMDASASYLERCLKKQFVSDDAGAELFNEPKMCPSTSLKFKEGMKLEAVDPLNLSDICVATVVKVLRQNYLMIKIDRQLSEEEDADEAGSIFCYHSTSACIAPAGFCEANAITLKPPHDFETRFRWGDYLRQVKAVSAPDALFVKDDKEHGLRVGMRIEATDLMDPRLVCVATIAQVAGRLVRVHFDGWSEEFDQWMDASSPEIYPIGWCELAGYRLEQPIVPAPPVVKRGKSRRGSRNSRGKSRARASVRPAGGVQPQAAAPVAADGSSKKGAGRPHGTVKVKTGASCDRELAAAIDNARSLRSKKRSHSLAGRATEDSAGSTAVPTKRSSAVWVNHDNNDVGESTMSSASSNSNESWNARSSLPKAAPGPPPLAPIKIKSDPIKLDPDKFIPRLIDVSPANRREALVGVSPLDWSSDDVAQFLTVNDCSAYYENFLKAKVDGQRLLTLSKDQVLELSNMKVGPSVKICDLIAQLKSRVSSTHLRQHLSLQNTGQSSLR